jgi:hypothetical protein
MAHSKVTDKNVIEMIKAMNLQPKALDVLIDTLIKQASILGKNPMEKVSKNQMQSLFTSDAFLGKFTDQYRAMFTDEEIFRLLEIYQSNPMKKLLEHGKELFEPLYHAMRVEIEKISE